ncbi:MAG: serine/threonine-protein kinase [Myxococcota bacterium]
MSSSSQPSSDATEADVTINATGAFEGRGRAASERVLRRGEALSRYVVLDRLGSGGMGVVYAAYDPQLDRRVAVKLLHERSDTRNARLLQEARALARLSDPHVVSVFDVGHHDEAVFIAMELVSGQTLDQWLATPRRWQETVDVFIAAGRGLSAAHEADLVHRDFKPGNVMIDEGGRVRVMDFGLVVAGNRDASAEPEVVSEEFVSPGPASSLTRTGSMLGTPRYMAPEQVHREPITAAADQFSFCLALHEALAGTHPFGDVLDAVALMVAIGEVQPQPLEVPEVPSSIRAAIARGLAREPADRWPSMEALVEALAAGRRPPRRLGVALAVATLAIGSVVYGVMAGSDAPTNPCPTIEEQHAELYGPSAQEAITRAFEGYDRNYDAESSDRVTQVDAWSRGWAESRVDACEATQVREEQSGRIMDARLACLAGKRRSFDAMVEVLSEPDDAALLRAVALVDGLPSIERCGDAEAVLSSVEPPTAEQEPQVRQLEQVLAKVRNESAAGHYEVAQAEAAEALAAARAVGYLPLVAKAQTVAGTIASQQQRNEEAERELVDAAWTALARGDRETALSAAAALVSVQRDISRVDYTLEWAERARTLSSPHDDPWLSASIDLGVSRALREVGRIDEAFAHASRAHDHLREQLGPDHLRVASADIERAAVEYLRRNYEQAETLARHGMRVRSDELGERHPQTGRSWMLVASIRSARGQHEEAEVANREALAIMSSAYGPRSRSVGGIYNNLGNVMLAQGHVEDAREAYEAAASIWEEGGHPDSVVYARWNLGRLHYGQGQAQGALDEMSHAWGLIESTDTGLHALRAKVAMGRGATLLSRGQVDAGCQALQDALDDERGYDATARAATRAFLAMCAEQRGDLEQARALAAEAAPVLRETKDRDDLFGEALVIANRLAPIPRE